MKVEVMNRQQLMNIQVFLKEKILFLFTPKVFNKSLWN